MLIIREGGSPFNGNTDEKTWTFIIGIAHGYNRAKSNVQTKLVFLLTILLLFCMFLKLRDK